MIHFFFHFIGGVFLNLSKARKSFNLPCTRNTAIVLAKDNNSVLFRNILVWTQYYVLMLRLMSYLWIYVCEPDCSNFLFIFFDKPHASQISQGACWFKNIPYRITFNCLTIHIYCCSVLFDRTASSSPFLAWGYTTDLVLLFYPVFSF